MKWIKLYSLYSRFSTKWYVGFGKGKFDSSTRRRDLENVLNYFFVHPKGGFGVAYCPKHHHVIRFSLSSPFHATAIEKSQDCEEYEFFERIWFYNRNLGWAVVKEDKELALRTLMKTRKTVEPQDLDEIAKRLSFTEEEKMKVAPKILAKKFKAR